MHIIIIHQRVTTLPSLCCGPFSQALIAELRAVLSGAKRRIFVAYSSLGFIYLAWPILDTLQQKEQLS
jgi:hypothetical protein